MTTLRLGQAAGKAAAAKAPTAIGTQSKRRARARPRITINGKFMARELLESGVHRTALEFTKQLTARAATSAETRILAPAVQETETVRAHGLRPDIRPGLFGKGQAWEMLTLPALSRHDLLINFCNLAPLWHSNSIVMIHDAQTLLYPDAYPTRQVRGYRVMWPLIAKRARAILTVSEHSRQSLAENGVGTLDKIFVVPNGTDHILAEQPDNRILDLHGLRHRPFVFVMGSTQRYKNLRVVFEAFKDPRLADVTLVVSGEHDRAGYEASDLNPPKNTVFTGYVSDPELRALYQAAEVFLCPSKTEGFGLPPVEAMQCGTPALAGRGGAIPEVCRDGAVLIDPHDAEAWSHAIHTMIHDSEARDAQIARGSARAKELSWDRAGEILWARVSQYL